MRWGTCPIRRGESFPTWCPPGQGADTSGLGRVPEARVFLGSDLFGGEGKHPRDFGGAAGERDESIEPESIATARWDPFFEGGQEFFVDGIDREAAGVALLAIVLEA